MIPTIHMRTQICLLIMHSFVYQFSAVFGPLPVATAPISLQERKARLSKLTSFLLDNPPTSPLKSSQASTVGTNILHETNGNTNKNPSAISSSTINRNGDWALINNLDSNADKVITRNSLLNNMGHLPTCNHLTHLNIDKVPWKFVNDFYTISKSSSQLKPEPYSSTRNHKTKRVRQPQNLQSLKCQDSISWHEESHRRHDCKWVGQDNRNRCNHEATMSCPVACKQCLLETPGLVMDWLWPVLRHGTLTKSKDEDTLWPLDDFEMIKNSLEGQGPLIEIGVGHIALHAAKQTPGRSVIALVDPFDAPSLQKAKNVMEASNLYICIIESPYVPKLLEWLTRDPTAFFSHGVVTNIDKLIGDLLPHEFEALIARFVSLFTKSFIIFPKNTKKTKKFFQHWQGNKELIKTALKIGKLVGDIHSISRESNHGYSYYNTYDEVSNKNILEVDLKEVSRTLRGDVCFKASQLLGINVGSRHCVLTYQKKGNDNLEMNLIFDPISKSKAIISVSPKSYLKGLNLHLLMSLHPTPSTKKIIALVLFNFESSADIWLEIGQEAQNTISNATVLQNSYLDHQTLENTEKQLLRCEPASQFSVLLGELLATAGTTFLQLPSSAKISLAFFTFFPEAFHVDIQKREDIYQKKNHPLREFVNSETRIVAEMARLSGNTMASNNTVSATLVKIPDLISSPVVDSFLPWKVLRIDVRNLSVQVNHHFDYAQDGHSRKYQLHCESNGEDNVNVYLIRAKDGFKIPYNEIASITLIGILRMGLLNEIRDRFYDMFLDLPLYEDMAPWNIVFRNGKMEYIDYDTKDKTFTSSVKLAYQVLAVLMNYERTVRDFGHCGGKGHNEYGFPFISHCVGHPDKSCTDSKYPVSCGDHTCRETYIQCLDGLKQKELMKKKENEFTKSLSMDDRFRYTIFSDNGSEEGKTWVYQKDGPKIINKVRKV